MPTEAPIHTGSSIEQQLLDLFLYLGSAWILYLLLFLSIVSIAIALERVIHCLTDSDDVKRLHDRVSTELAKDDVDGAKAVLKKSRSAAARVALKGLDDLGRGAATVVAVDSGALSG